MFSVKNIKGLSVNCAGEGKGFRKRPSSHNWWPRGRSLADRSVHCQNTIRGCERRSHLERNTTEQEIGGRKALRGWGLVYRWHANDNSVGCSFGIWQVFIRALLQVTDSDWISYFQVVTTCVQAPQDGHDFRHYLSKIFYA
jgi:hypothetical protein